MTDFKDYGLIIKPSNGHLIIEGFEGEGGEVAVTMRRSSVERVAGSTDVASVDGETEEKLCAILLNDSRSAEVIGNMFLSAANRLRGKVVSWVASVDKQLLEE